MDAIEFLDSAEKIIQNNKEVDYRNAVSRAYYCAYHKTASFVEPLNLERSFGATHEKLVGILQNHTNKKLKTIGNKLNALREFRVDADYKLNKPFSFQDAQSALKRTKALLQDIDSFTNAEN